MPEGLVRELREVEPASLPERDMRAGRPLLLQGILRFDSLRAIARIATLAALDLAGLVLAIYTALVLKTAIVNPDQLGQMWGQTKDYAPLAGLVMLLLFARSGLYRDRAQRPGFSKVIASLFQVTLVVLVYAAIEGENFQSYYIFYSSLFFALLYVSALRFLFERGSGVVLRAAGYRRRAVLVGSGPNIQAVALALDESSAIEPYGFVSRTPPALVDGLRDFRSLEQLERNFDAIDEVLIADPDFPQEEAVELVDRCHRQGVRVRVAPSTMEILMDRAEFVPGQALPLFELKPPVFDGLDFAVKRIFDLIGAVLLLVLLSPIMIGCGARDQAELARTRALPLVPARDRRAALHLLQVPDDGGGGRGASGAPGDPQRAQRRAVQDPRRSPRSRRSGASCAAGRSTSCLSSSTCCAVRCRSWARARCPSATTTASRTGTASAIWCCRG